MSVSSSIAELPTQLDLQKSELPATFARDHCNKSSCLPDAEGMSSPLLSQI